MSNNRKTSARSRLWPLRPCHACLLLLASAALAWTPAKATTESETALTNSPLPHEQLGRGRESVKVHWVRLLGYLEGEKGHAAMLDQLKADVQSCVRSPLSGQSRPPQVWPDYVQRFQSDTYEAANRRIIYSTTLGYAVNPTDCSLIETRQVKAQLASTKGTCEIDFNYKTADGVCDALAHSNAPALVNFGRQAAPGGRGGATNAPSQAALAAMEQAMKRFAPVKTGEHKTIAGIECEVQTQALSGTVCISRGGSFPGWSAARSVGGAGVELEWINVAGSNAQAVKAQLDASVNAAVFAPYLTGGFRVPYLARRK